VQRAVICLRAKDVDFRVTYIDLRDKPDWFLAISPHGKVPVLEVDGEPLFESSAIAEFLDEVVPPRLHPQEPVSRARNRAWTDFVPDFAAAIGAVNYSKSAEALADALELARKRLERVEEALGERGNDGPFFNGSELSLVDAAYAPFLQRFTLVEEKLATGLLDGFPRVRAWRDALLADERVTGSVSEAFPEAFTALLHRRGAQVAPLFDAA
jgi:glutathione S-transferase